MTTPTTIKERPILFSGAMVRALLDGSKTQTRRVVKPQPDNGISSINGNFITNGSITPIEGGNLHRLGNTIRCPYGQPGERLWVRETFYAFGYWGKRWKKDEDKLEWTFADITLNTGRSYQYEQPADYVRKRRDELGVAAWHKRPSIFMPRAASRLLLEITAVRCERVQQISVSDVRAEGCELREFNFIGADAAERRRIAADVYGNLWVSINGAESWCANPWVWVVEFKQVSA
jgi:hypothetical protein